MFDLTLAELARGLQGGEFSSTELTRAYLQRIKTLDARYNSFITVTEEQALAQAEAADAARAAGAGGALGGCVPPAPRKCWTILSPPTMPPSSAA
jgi:aspartyl-tRNA(Asn)/glutamyl-tRNA(Gln) amidotransferase subunit A